jgi:hypothetical protein
MCTIAGVAAIETTTVTQTNTPIRQATTNDATTRAKCKVGR